MFIISGSTLNAGSNKHFNNPIDGDGKEISQQSDDYKLFQNFPNPFNPLTRIAYKINKDGFVSLKVFNLVGQVVGALVYENQKAGTYEVDFDASNLPTGVYLYKLQINGFTSVKRMTVLK